MSAKTVKEIHVGRIAENNSVGMKVLLEDDKEIDLHLSRDIAINLIQQIYVALDSKGIHKPVDLH